MSVLRKPLVAVTGREGQVAQALAQALPSAGFEVITWARPVFDLQVPERLADEVRRCRPDVVVSAAAYTAVDKAEDDRDAAFAANATAPGVLARAAAEVDALVVHLSTDYVFDGRKRVPYLETDPVAPLGVYGASKLAGEAAVAASGARHVILRTAWVCSPHGHNFVKTMLRLGAERDTLRVVDDQHGAPTFADDIAEAIAAITTRAVTDGRSTNVSGVYHLASAGETTWCGFARAIMAGAVARGRSPMAAVEAITTADYPTRSRRPAYSTLDCSRLAATWGIALPHWSVGLGRCLDALIGANSKPPASR